MIYNIVHTTGNNQAGGASGGCVKLPNASCASIVNIVIIDPPISGSRIMPVAMKNSRTECLVCLRLLLVFAIIYSFSLHLYYMVKFYVIQCWDLCCMI